MYQEEQSWQFKNNFIEVTSWLMNEYIGMTIAFIKFVCTFSSLWNLSPLKAAYSLNCINP